MLFTDFLFYLSAMTAIALAAMLIYAKYIDPKRPR